MATWRRLEETGYYEVTQQGRGEATYKEVVKDLAGQRASACDAFLERVLREKYLTHPITVYYQPGFLTVGPVLTVDSRTNARTHTHGTDRCERG